MQFKQVLYLEILQKRIARNFKTGKTVSAVISELDLGNVSDETELLKIVEKVIADEPQAVEQAKSNIQTINYLVGKVMQATKGKADPTLTLNLLKKQIGI